MSLGTDGDYRRLPFSHQKHQLSSGPILKASNALPCESSMGSCAGIDCISDIMVDRTDVLPVS